MSNYCPIITENHKIPQTKKKELSVAILTKILTVNQINEQLISFLKSQNPEDCILWTKADKNRVEAILNYFDLKKYFIWIFYSDKTNIINDINFMTKKLCCSKCDLIIFDDIKY